MDRLRRRARRGRVQVDRRRPDHVHVGHDGPLEGRHQAERRRLLLGPRPARGGLRDRRQVGGVAVGGHLLQLPAAVPLQRPGALRLPGARRRRPRRLRRAVLLQQVLAADHRRRGDGLQLDRRRQLLHLEHPRLRPRPRSTRCTPASPRRRRRTSTTSSRSASGSSSSRATASPRPAWPPTWTPPSRRVPGLDGQGQPRLRGHDRRARHRQAAAARHPRRDRRRHAASRTS